MCRDNILVEQKARASVLIGRPSTLKMISGLFSGVLFCLGAFAWPQGASDPQEQPNHWLRASLEID